MNNIHFYTTEMNLNLAHPGISHGELLSFIVFIMFMIALAVGIIIRSASNVKTIVNSVSLDDSISEKYMTLEREYTRIKSEDNKTIRYYQKKYSQSMNAKQRLKEKINHLEKKYSKLECEDLHIRDKLNYYMELYQRVCQQKKELEQPAAKKVWFTHPDNEINYDSNEDINEDINDDINEDEENKEEYECPEYIKPYSWHLNIKDFTRNSFVVTGSQIDLYKEDIERMGGRWTLNLRGGISGWVFPNNKRWEVEKYLDYHKIARPSGSN